MAIGKELSPHVPKPSLPDVTPRGRLTISSKGRRVIKVAIAMKRNVTSESVYAPLGKQRKIDEIDSCVKHHRSLYLEGYALCPNCHRSLAFNNTQTQFRDFVFGDSQ